MIGKKKARVEPKRPLTEKEQQEKELEDLEHTKVSWKDSLSVPDEDNADSDQLQKAVRKHRRAGEDAA